MTMKATIATLLLLAAWRDVVSRIIPNRIPCWSPPSASRSAPPPAPPRSCSPPPPRCCSSPRSSCW
ncbi:hypothetical protein ACFQU2_08960 [Siccirubricoccus deserti]